MTSFVRSLSGVMSLLIASVVLATEDSALTNGGDLTIKDIQYNRSLPQAFYDQAVTSLPLLYPNHQLLVARRTGVLGEVEYALICFKETSKSRHGVIEAIAVFEERAWHLKKITPPSCGEALVDILEYIANLPSNPTVQRKPAGR